MYKHRIIVTFGLILFLIGCTGGTDSSSQGTNDKFTQISNESPIDQSVSNQAKQLLSKNDDITTVKAVNTTKTLVIALEVHHNKRFQLAKTRKKLKKKLKKEFPDKKIELSTDRKAILELQRLEKKINASTLSKKKLKDEVKQLVNLLNEQT